MFVFRVGVPGDDVLIVFEPHAIQIPLPYLSPLLVRQMFARSGGQGNVQYRFVQLRPQLSDLAKFGRQFPRRLSPHVGVEYLAFFFI